VDVSLDLERGSFTVVTGRVGAGKTTLLRVLLGLLPRDNGEILWNGTQIDDPAEFFLPPRSAYAPQVPHLFGDTIWNNILLGLPADEAALQVALERAVLDTDVARLDQGLETVVGPRGVRLSGGQLQRTAAARLFIRAADLVVFDDVSSALDVETERLLWERLAALDGQSRLVVSHRRAALEQADQIVVLKHGRVEGSGTLEQLLGNCDEMRRLWSGDKDRDA
jgi:ATP-binding cassette subfamily B protein